MAKRLRISLLVPSIITITILILYFNELPKSENNYNLLKNIIILYLVSFASLILVYILKNTNKLIIARKFFVYGQIYNIISFIFGIIFYEYIRFDIRAFNQLSIFDKIVNIFFFPGSYFYDYFYCDELGWTCFGSTFGITIIFNTILFTTIGFILGIVLNLLWSKK